MSYSVTKMAGEPVIIIKFHSDFDAHVEAQQAFEAGARLLAEQTEPVFSIWDVRQSTADLQSIMEGANVSRTNVAPVNERASIVVTNDPVVKLAMEGMNSEVYGHVVIPVFETLEEALAYVHEQPGTA
jgi:hypothetical protein